MNKKSVVIIVIIFFVASLFLYMKYAEKKVKSDFQELIKSGANEQLREIGDALQVYKTAHGQCPENLEDLYPDYILSKDTLFYGKDKKMFNYDGSKCDVSFNTSVGFGF